jgi:Fic family protein
MRPEPPSPRLTITPHLLASLTSATELRAWITQAVVDVSWLPALQSETAARLAHSSTAIEGNPLTLSQVEAIARGEDVGAAEKAQQEVRNHLSATRWIWARKHIGTISEKELLQLHRLLTQKTLPSGQVGRYKTRANRVIDAKGHTVHTPPPPEHARTQTRQMLSWIDSKESHALHPVLVGAIAHHWLVTLHPFADGNGRLARALEAWLFFSRGFDTHHLFALDEYFEQDRKTYYDKIQQARELDGDLTYWLEYVAHGVVETLRRTQERIRSLQVKTKAPRIVLTRRQEEVLKLLRDQGRLRSPDLERAFKLTRARVNQILRPLVESGLVMKEGQTRATAYRLAASGRPGPM